MRSTTLPDELRADVQTLWDYHDMHHELRPTDVGIGLGSHDLGVATYTAELFHVGAFPLIVFTGANAPTTVGRFPRGEAVHYREHALALGVQDDVILVEPEARNTGENITFTRALLDSRRVEVGSVVLISRPYQQRRAYATCKKLWPEVDVICGSRPLPLDEYIESIGDVDRVINMLVGDTQRITIYAERGFAIQQEVPNDVTNAYGKYVKAPFIAPKYSKGAFMYSPPETRRKRSTHFGKQNESARVTLAQLNRTAEGCPNCSARWHQPWTSAFPRHKDKPISGHRL